MKYVFFIFKLSLAISPGPPIFCKYFSENLTTLHYFLLQVLLSNNMACQLLGFKSSELQKLTLDDFVLDPEHGRGIEAMAETEIFQKIQPEGDSNFRQNDTDATTMNGQVLISGKVVSTTLFSSCN